MSIFVQSVKAKTQDNIEINYSLNLKALRQKLKPINNFEKQPNFTLVLDHFENPILEKRLYL